MKVRLTFKTPDVVDNAISMLDGTNEIREIENACKKWVEYGEYATIEIDTETGTATVIPV